MAERTPLILVPGLLCTKALWGPQIEALADIADIAVAETALDDSFEAMAERLLRNAPAKFALAGLSMGGYVVFEALRQAPERIVKIALIDTNARADRPDQIAARRDAMALAERGEFRGVTDRLLPFLIHPARLDDEALTRLIKTMAREVGKDAFLRQQTAIMKRPDSRPMLAGIACPAMVIVGREDAITPLKVAEEMARGIPNATLHAIEDCGHLSTLERPEEVARLMRAWL